MAYNLDHYHGDAVTPVESENIEFEDFQNEIIFYNKVWTAFPADVDNEEIIKDCYDAQIHLPGTQRSNAGGWQSEVRPLTESVFRATLPHVYDIGVRAVEFANKCSEELGSDIEYNLDSAHLWVNINNMNDYNVIHSHPHCDLIVLYYAIHQKNMGNLHLVRADGSCHVSTFMGMNDSHEYIVEPEEGMFVAFPPHLLHYVDPNQTGNDRISISFNMAAVNG